MAIISKQFIFISTESAYNDDPHLYRREVDVPIYTMYGQSHQLLVHLDVI